DDTIMGFGFPKEEREALVASEPDKFLMPRPSDMRYRWVCVRLDSIDVEELRELLVDAWRMCVPKKVAAAYEGGRRPRAAAIAVARTPPRNRSMTQNARFDATQQVPPNAGSAGAAIPSASRLV